ncbi:hypothetical protein DNX43_20195 [Shigella flexneri]|nr:hypothetical protein [Shigella flexneri]
MGSCAAPSAKGDDKFITTDYLQQCRQYYSFYKFERLKSHIKAISQDKQQYPVLRESVLAARLQF